MTLNTTHSLDDNFSYIPVKDKKPLIPWQKYQSTKATAEEIAGWGQQFPGHDLGIVTGPISGILVLDLDGAAGYAAAIRAGGPLPLTWRARTKNDGCHVYLQWDDRLKELPTTRVGTLEKVDIRGRGGYVVSYPWVEGFSPADVPLAPIPDWLMALLTNKPASTEVLGNNPSGWIADSLNNLDEGRRHQTFAKLIGRLNRDGFAADDIYTLLAPHAEACGLGKAELRTQVGKMVRLYADQAAKPMSLMSTQQLLSRAQTSIPWLVDGLFPKEGVGILAGHPKIGKSWLTLSLAIAVGTGTPWLNHWPTVPGRFLYLDEESSVDLLGFRLRKLLAHQGHKNLDGQFMVKEGFSFSSDAKVLELRRALDTIQPSLVVMDSFNRIHSANENSASEIGAIFRKVGAIAKDYSCFILFTDHLPYGHERFRGSGDKAAFVDAGFLASQVGNSNLLVEHKYARHSTVPSFELALLDDGPEKTFVRWIG
jgi:hypothetical protein